MTKKKKKKELEIRQKFVIFTDGSANNVKKPHYGGWAYVILDTDENIIKEECGSAMNVTNNQMELTAICNALWNTPFGSEIVVITDSKYSIGALSNKNWELKANTDIVQNCKEAILSQGLNVHFKWVKGHSGEKWNEYVNKKAYEEYFKTSGETSISINVSKSKEKEVLKAKKQNCYKEALQELVFSIEDYQATKQKAIKMVEDARERYVIAFNNAKEIIYEKIKTGDLDEEDGYLNLKQISHE